MFTKMSFPVSSAAARLSRIRWCVGCVVLAPLFVQTNLKLTRMLSVLRRLFLPSKTFPDTQLPVGQPIAQVHLSNLPPRGNKDMTAGLAGRRASHWSFTYIIMHPLTGISGSHLGVCHMFVACPFSTAGRCSWQLPFLVTASRVIS